MANFTFDPKEHVYTLDGRPLTGVTTILGVINKPALIQWAAKMAAHHIRDNFDGDLTDELIEAAINAHRKKKTEAADKGTDIHALAEEWIKTGKLPDPVPAPLQKFIDWATENKVEFVASEIRCYSAKDWYAGTADFICKINGKRYVGDLKTSSGIYGREYFFQVAAYRNALEEMGEEPIEGTIIVRCGKKGDFEVVESHEYLNDLAGFKAALALYRALEYKPIK